MRIWIVASDPFYRDFEKIAGKWGPLDQVKISLASKFGYDLESIKNFLSIYLKFKPEVILTDFGYFGFFFVQLFSKILGRKVKISFFLRGNYWLEERIRRDAKSA